MLVQGVQERSQREMMDELSRFITVDNLEVLNVGDLRDDVESRKVATDFLEAAAWEGADELTLRTQEEDALRTFTFTPRI